MREREGLRDGAFRHTEAVIQSYYKYPQWIKKREEELHHPHKQTDVNQGGGGNIPSSPTENTAMRLMLDKQLKQWNFEYAALKEMMVSADDETLKIIELWYLEKPRRHTWDGVSLITNVSRRQCIRLRNEFVRELSEKLSFF